MNRPLKNRRGTLYIAVLGTAMMVSIAALCAMQVARVSLTSTAEADDVARARHAANAGVDYALDQIDMYGDGWRSQFTSGVREPQFTDLQLPGAGEFKYEFDVGTREDDTPRALTDSDADVVTLRGIGWAGAAVSVAEVTLVNNGAAYDCLEASFASQQDVSLTDVVRLTVDRFTYAGRNIAADWGTPSIDGDAEAAGLIESGIVNGNATEGVTARSFPNTDALFEYYKQNGVMIDVNSLPVIANVHRINEKVLSPASNPFGVETNPEGIYVIDCQQQDVQISNSRIVGTLVLLNNTTNTQVSGVVNWASAVENYPALMVENDITLACDGFSLLQESLYGVSFNPPGTPSNGIEDFDSTDAYPSDITGLIYVGGRLLTTGTSSPKVSGVVVCGSARLETNMQVNYRRVHFDSPPPGFVGQGAVKVLAGSWRRGEN